MSVIELKNINKYFGTGTSRVHVLSDVNFAADKANSFWLSALPVPVRVPF